MTIELGVLTSATIIPLPPAVNDMVPAVLASFKVLTTLLVHQATYIHNTRDASLCFGGQRLEIMLMAPFLFAY